MKAWIRNSLIGAGALLLVGGTVVGGSIGYLASSLPASQGPRVEVTDGIVGVETGGSYAWIVRTEGGAILVDAGMDVEAVAIRQELGAMGLGLDDVHTILLTHAHRDHTGGLSAFPRARLVHGPGEGAVLRGEDDRAGLMPSIFNALVPAPPLPADTHAAADGDVLDVDGLEVRVVSTPGHTPGSTSFVVRDGVFAGDAVFADGQAMMVPPGFLNADDAQARRSVRRLAPLDPAWVADGHAGITRDAGPKLGALAGE